MTIIVWLVLLMGTDPIPTFGVLDTFTTVQECQESKMGAVKRMKLTPAQAVRMQCMPIITSVMSAPL